MENKKEKQIKLLAIQGILAIFKESEQVPNIEPIEAIHLMNKTIGAFEDEIRADEVGELNKLLRELLDEVL